MRRILLAVITTCFTSIVSAQSLDSIEIKDIDTISFAQDSITLSEYEQITIEISNAKTPLEKKKVINRINSSNTLSAREKYALKSETDKWKKAPSKSDKKKKSKKKKK